MYRHITIQGSVNLEPKLRSILRVILTDSKLASRVDSFEFAAPVEVLPARRTLRPPRGETDDEVYQFTRAVRSLGLPTQDQSFWIFYLRRSDMDALLALVIAHLPNVTQLSVVLPTVHTCVKRIFETTIDPCVSSIQRFAKLVRLALRFPRVARHPLPGAWPTDLDSTRFLPLRIPSLRFLSCEERLPVIPWMPWPGATIAPTSLTSLELRCFPCHPALESLLEACPLLETLKICLLNGQTERDLDCDLIQAMKGCQDTLKHLTIRREHLRAKHSVLWYPLDSLHDFKSLTTVEIHQYFVVNPHPANPDLPDLLPPSLRYLHVQAVEDQPDILLRQLKCLAIACLQSRFPDLKTVLAPIRWSWSMCDDLAQLERTFMDAQVVFCIEDNEA